MIRKLDDRDATVATELRVLKRWLDETEEMIRLGEQLCAQEPESFAYVIQLKGLKNRREKILEELEEVRTRVG